MQIWFWQYQIKLMEKMEGSFYLLHPRTFHDMNYPSFWLPYSVLAIGSQINKLVDVNICDNNLGSRDSPEIASEIINSGAPYLGISSMIGHQLKEGLEVAEIVKNKKPEIPIIFGGAAATMLSEEIISTGFVDFVIRGQGEKPLEKLLSLNGDFSDERLSEVLGLTYKNSFSMIKSTQNTPVLKRNSIENYDFSLLNLESYIQNDAKINSRTINYVASQGCPFNCGFCSDTNLFDKVWTGFDPNVVISDIKYLQENFGINGVKFYDSNFIINKKLTENFARGLLGLENKIKWGAAIHPATFCKVEDSFLDLLAESGCSRLLIGAESGNQEVLDLVGKKLEPGDMIDIAKRASLRDISISFTAIVGFPEVPENHYDETFELGERLRQIDLNHEVKIHIYAPFPMTSLYQKAINNGFQPPKTLEGWSNYDYYSKQTPWISNEIEERVNKFNKENSSAVSKV